MKLSGDSRGWMWTALALLAAASCTIRADGNSSVTTASTGTSKAVTPLVNTTSPPIIEKGNSSTTPVPVTSNSSAATSPSTTTPIHNTTHSTATTQGHATTNVSSTTVTSKVTVKTSAVIATSSSPPTSSISTVLQKISGFDLGSFIGGIVLTLGFLAAVYFGCRFYNSKRGVRYRTIDEHEAII